MVEGFDKHVRHVAMLAWRTGRGMPRPYGIQEINARVGVCAPGWSLLLVCG
jgi:hypothetical protein